MKGKEVPVVILDGITATRADMSGGESNLFENFFPLIRAQSEEAIEPLEHEFFPIGGVFFIRSGKSDRGLVFSSLFFSKHMADADATDENGEKSHENGEVITKARFHGAVEVLGVEGDSI